VKFCSSVCTECSHNFLRLDPMNSDICADIQCCNKPPFPTTLHVMPHILSEYMNIPYMYKIYYILQPFYVIITQYSHYTTLWTTKEPGFYSLLWAEIILFSTVREPAPWPNHRPTKMVPGALSTGVKRTGREADHSDNPAGWHSCNSLYSYCRGAHFESILIYFILVFLGSSTQMSGCYLRYATTASFQIPSHL
jgi:hypothetical protein